MALLFAQSCADEPQSYADCVLQALEGSGKTEAALDLIQEACREKFPSAEPSSIEPVSERPASPTSGVYNPELGVALQEIPSGFRVIRNHGGELILGRNGRDSARLTFEVGPIQETGVNLVERVWFEKARIESLPEGEYRGQNELGGVPIGTTFTSRGRFVNEEGKRVEEYRALTVHPTENRVLVLDYEYPLPPPSQEEGPPARLQELVLVLEQVEVGAALRPSERGGTGAARHMVD